MQKMRFVVNVTDRDEESGHEISEAIAIDAEDMPGALKALIDRGEITASSVKLDVYPGDGSEPTSA